MAFTLAHMAAALPFYRCQKWLNVEAMLIGTMLPDLPYFLNSKPIVAQHSHQWLGLLTYCLPWGLAVFVLWHWVLRSALLALIQPWYALPYNKTHRIQPDLPQHPFGQWLAAKVQYWFRHDLWYWGAFWLKIVAGLLLGAATHLLWDGTTHPDGFIAVHIAWLQHPITVSELGSMPMARFLQYLSSVLGLGLILFFIKQRLHAATLLNKPSIQAKKYTFQKWQSALIIILLLLCSLVWGLQAATKYNKLLLNDSYLYFAKILVGLLQGAGAVFILYASLRWIILRLKMILKVT